VQEVLSGVIRDENGEVWSSGWAGPQWVRLSNAPADSPRCCICHVRMGTGMRPRWRTGRRCPVTDRSRSAMHSRLRWHRCRSTCADRWPGTAAELARHAELTAETGIRVYFCDPYSPWPRGTNENTNALLRQYFPKGTDLARYRRSDVQAVTDALNNRPRKTHGWRTPAEVLAEQIRSASRHCVATTGWIRPDCRHRCDGWAL